MEHQAGTDVLTRYGQYIDQFCFECKQKFVDAIASARAFHQGGDEMAVVIIFKPGFDNPRMQHALSTTLVQDMANKDIHMFGKDYNKPFCADGVTENRVPTMLRVGRIALTGFEPRMLATQPGPSSPRSNCVKGEVTSGHGCFVCHIQRCN